MKKYNFFMGVLLMSMTLLWVLSGCRHKDTCDTPTHFRTSAEFQMLEKVNLFDDPHWFETDTTFKGCTVKFKAKPGMDSYQWRIGTDTRVFTKQEFDLEFDVYGKIKVTLITHKKPDTACFPDDDGIDSVSQYITFIDDCDLPLYGSFVGHDEDNPSLEYQIDIHCDAINHGIHNFPNGCPDNYPTPSESIYPAGTVDGFTAFYILPTIFGHDCHLQNGWGVIGADRKSVLIDYVYQEGASSPKINKRFVGRKL